MRRYFGGDRNMGGGSGGGGGMVRSVHRVFRTGIGGAPPDPFTPSTGSVATSSSRKTKRSRIKQPSSPSTNLTLSSSSSNNSNNGPSAFSSLINLPISAASGAAAPAWRACSPPTCDDLEWEYVEGSGGDEKVATRAFYDDFVFATVPSRNEVQHVVSALQQVAGIRHRNDKLADDSGTNFPNGDGSLTGTTKSISSEELESDWVEPSLPSPFLCDYKMLQPQGSQTVYDAFHLLQTDPSVQRMVISLSSDKAVWDAVLNNDVVRELRSTITRVDEVNESAEASPDDGSNPLKEIMDWVSKNARAKIMELINKITEIVHDIFHPSDKGKRDGITDPVEEKLRTSLLLSVVVLLIVVISRVKRG